MCFVFSFFFVAVLVVFDGAKLDGLQSLNKSCSKVFMQVQNVFTQMHFFTQSHIFCSEIGQNSRIHKKNTPHFSCRRKKRGTFVCSSATPLSK